MGNGNRVPLSGHLVGRPGDDNENFYYSSLDGKRTAAENHGIGDTISDRLVAGKLRPVLDGQSQGENIKTEHTTTIRQNEKVERPNATTLRKCPIDRFVRKLPPYPQNTKIFEKERYEDPDFLDDYANYNMSANNFPKIITCIPYLRGKKIIFEENKNNKLTNPFFDVITVREVDDGAKCPQGEFFYCNKDGTLFGRRISHAISALGQYVEGDKKLKGKFQTSYAFVKTPNGEIYFVDLRTGEKTKIDRRKDQLSLQYDGKEVNTITINNGNDLDRAKISIIKG